MQFTPGQVWGLAVEADRINGGYLKESVYARNLDVIEKQANKLMVKEWLRAGRMPSDADIEEGLAVRHYFNGFLLKQISGKINDFERQALRIAQMEEFAGNNMLEFAIVSCLPSTMRRDQERNDVARDIRDSTQLTGNVGDTVQGEVEIVKCYYSQEYNKYRITAKLVDSFVDFWYNKDLAKGDRVKLKGKIKTCRGDLTTQLNYVKITG
jgi:MoaA/NifB/PqqE/SkfB family radical SAM enzyme